MKRVLTAVVLIPIIAYVVLWANFWVFLGVLVLVACQCYREYEMIAADYGFGAPGPLGYGAGLLLLVWEGDAWLVMLAMALVAVTIGMRGELNRTLPRAALLVIGVVYIFGSW